jgi:hypothetical protein
MGELVKTDEKPQADIVAPEDVARATASAIKLLSDEELHRVYRMAQVFARSDLIPRELQNNASNVFLVLAQALELNISPGQALQSVYIVNGRAAVFGDLFLALIQRHPKYEWHREYFEGEFGEDTFQAVCEIKRLGIEPAFKREFSIADAKRAKLWGKVGRNNYPTPWVTYPKRMLQMRARTWCGRDAFADALKGLTTVEEMRDVEVYPKDAKHVASEVTEPQRGAEGLKDRLAKKANPLDATNPFAEKPEAKPEEKPEEPPKEETQRDEPPAEERQGAYQTAGERGIGQDPTDLASDQELLDAGFGPDA